MSTICYNICLGSSTQGSRDYNKVVVIQNGVVLIHGGSGGIFCNVGQLLCHSRSMKYTGAGRTIIEGANIHIFVFTDCKNNRFQKKLIKQNAHI